MRHLETSTREELLAALAADPERAHQLVEAILDRAFTHTQRHFGADTHDQLHALRDAHVPPDWVLPRLIARLEAEDQAARSAGHPRHTVPNRGLCSLDSSDALPTLLSSYGTAL